MTDNPSYRGEPGQGRPGDEYYDDQYGRPQEEQRPAYPEQGGYPPSYEQGYPPRPAYPAQGGYPDPGYGQPQGQPHGQPHGQGYAPNPYEQRPPGYPPQGGAPGYEQGYRPAPPPPHYGQQTYGPPPGGGYAPPAGEYDYGRPRHDEPGYGRPEPRPAYPDQGYQQPGYGQPDYGRYDQGGYDQGGYAPAAPPAGDYEYGQPAGYGGYAPAPGQGEYAGAVRTVTLQLDDGSGRTYQLREGANVIGRGQDAQFRLPDTGVSRRHLEIRWDGQAALLSDLNSTNGTTVNNAPVQEWQLADGDVIRVGHSEIIVHVR